MKPTAPGRRGGEAGQLAELAAEMLDIGVAAEGGDLGDFMLAEAQLLLGQPNPALDDILHAGDAEGGFVDGLEVAGADVQIPGHRGYSPRVARIAVQRLAQLQQIIILRRQLVLGRFGQLVEQEAEQVVNGQLPVIVLERVLQRQQLEQLMAIPGVGQENGLPSGRTLSVIYDSSASKRTQSLTYLREQAR